MPINHEITSDYLRGTTLEELERLAAENLDPQQTALFDYEYWPDCAIDLLANYLTGEEDTTSPE